MERKSNNKIKKEQYSHDQYNEEYVSDSQSNGSSQSRNNNKNKKGGKVSELNNKQNNQNLATPSKKVRIMAQVETTFLSAIQILKRNMDKQQEVQQLEEQLKNISEVEDFEPIIYALNDAAIEYLQIKEAQKALQIINFSYEACILEQVPIELQADTMLNYCIICKKSKDFQNGVDMINKCISLSQEHPHHINLGTVYGLYSSILRKQNKFREALEAAKRGLFQSEQRLKQISRNNDEYSDIKQQKNNEEYLIQQSNQLRLEVASSQYYLSLCEIALQNKKGALVLLQSAINKVSQILGHSHPTTMKYNQKFNQISPNYKGKEEKSFQGQQYESGYSSSNSFHKQGLNQQFPTFTYNQEVNEKYNQILNKNNSVINHNFHQNNYMDDQTYQCINKVQRKQQRPQSSKSNYSNTVPLNRKSQIKNLKITQPENKLKFFQSNPSKNRSLMFQDFAGSVKDLRPSIIQQKQNGNDFYFDHNENQETDKMRFFQETVQSMKDENDRQKRQLGYLQIKIRDSDNLQEKITQSNKKATLLTAQVEELQKQINELKFKSDKCDKEHPAEIQKLNSIVRERSDVLRKVLEKNQLEINKYEERIQKMKIEEDKKQRDVNDKICTFELTNSKNQLLISTLQNENRTEQENHLMILQNKDKDIKNLNLQLQQRETYFEVEVEKYQKQIGNTNELNNQIKQLEKQLNQLTEQKNMIDQSCARQRIQIQDLNAECSQLTEKYSSANTELKGKEITIKQLEETIAKLSQFVAQSANAAKLQEQLDKEKNNFERVQEENKRLQNLHQDSQKELAEKEKIIEQFQLQKDNSEKDKQSRHKQENDLIQTLQKENEAHTKNLQQLNDLISTLKNENEQHKQNQQKQNSKNEEELKNQNELIKQENQQLKEKIKNLEQSVHNQEDKINDYEQNLNLLGQFNKTFVEYNPEDMKQNKNKAASAIKEEDYEEDDEFKDNSIGDIQNDLEQGGKRIILVLQQYDKKFQALFDFQFDCSQHKLCILKTGKEIMKISMNQNVLHLFYTSKNYFIFSKILRRFSTTFLHVSKGQYAEEFVFDVDDITFKYQNNEIKFDPLYIKYNVSKLSDQIQAAFALYSFFSNETSDQKLEQMTTKKDVTESMVQTKHKTIDFGEGIVQCDKTKENVTIKYIYDVKKQNLKIESANPQIQGMKIPIKKEEAQQWIVNHKVNQTNNKIIVYLDLSELI